jgi:hypothetical protein
MPAAVMGDMGGLCIVPTPIILGSIGVLIGGRPAARLGDPCVAGPVLMGIPTVLIGEIGLGLVFPPFLSMDQVALLFFILSSIESIAFKFPRDGCYARAQIMANLLISAGVSPRKAWTFSSDAASDPLWVDSTNVPEGRVEWGYHVAPTVEVTQPDGSVQTMVIDPSMYDHPVRLDQWVSDQHDNPDVVQTDIGQPPIPAYGGSGYWPAPDPAEGADTHAMEIMEDYKMKEGT